MTEVRIDLLPAEARACIEAAAEWVGNQLPIVMVFRREDDEVPDVFNDFHPDRIKALAAP